MVFGDAIAVIALFVSVGTFLWSLGVESRLRRQMDARATFDDWAKSPLDNSIQRFARAIDGISAAIQENSSDTNARVQEIRRIQSHELNRWFFDLEAIAEHKSDGVFQIAITEAIAALDATLEVINSVSEDISEDGALRAARTLSGIQHRFSSKVSAEIHTVRLGIGHKKSRRIIKSGKQP